MLRRSTPHSINRPTGHAFWLGPALIADFGGFVAMAVDLGSCKVRRS